MWRYRDITPIGKIQVINSLMASLITYRLMALPKPPDKFFTDFKTVTTQFLWNSSTSKVSYDKIIKDYVLGGLKLIDLPAKDIAMKVGWIIRNMASEQPESSPLYYELPIANPIIWECNIWPSDFKIFDRELFIISTSVACLV